MSHDPSITETISLSESGVIRNAISEVVELFANAWANAPPEPQIDESLTDVKGPLRFHVLVELIKVDLENRAKADSPPALEHYVARWPELLSQDRMTPDLVYEDYQIRRRHDRPAELEDYKKRFPTVASAMERMAGDLESGATTSLATSRQVAQLEPGQTIGDFDLLVRLGKGAFATVYLARQNSMQRLVALKVSADHGFEPQTLAQLDHPNIVRVFDQQRLPDHDLRLLYMQYLRGGTLHRAVDILTIEPREMWTGAKFVEIVDRNLTDRGEEPARGSSYRKSLAAMSWSSVVCHIGQQLADALSYAHGQGVLHRDIKPANVLLTADGLPKLVDFNVSFSGEVRGASPATFFGGSLSYMSPEQLEACDPAHEHVASDLDGRSDLYSLGVLLYELLTGKKAFGTEYMGSDWRTTLAELTTKRKNGLSREHQLILTSDNSDASELLSDAILRCLAADPKERFQKAGNLASQLRLAAKPGVESFLNAPSLITKPIIGQLVTVIVLCLLIVPNGLAAVFVFTYNDIEAVPEVIQPLFWKTQSVINGIAFPFATALVLYAILPVAAAVRDAIKMRGTRKRERSISSHDTSQDNAERVQRIVDARSQNLLLGHWGACVCFPFWMIAGWLYPTVLSRHSAELPLNAWLDFVGSHFLAGLMSACYVFFGITYFCLSAWQSQLVRESITVAPNEKEKRSVERLGKYVSFYQFLAAVIPFAAMSFLAVWGGAENRISLIFLSLASLIAAAMIFWISKRIHQVLSVLEVLANPLDLGGGQG